MNNADVTRLPLSMDVQLARSPELTRKPWKMMMEVMDRFKKILT